MENYCVTTPFGRRSMSFVSLAKQRQVGQAPENKRNKWKLFRAICEARKELEVSDRSLSVLDALLSFYPSEELDKVNGLVVFPSNAQLSIRARGMTAATLRRHLAALIDAGLILRKDSANGKRFARKSRSGEINEAFGFSLAPLLSRASEIEDLAARVSADREFLHATRERISLCRRDITKLIQLALDSGVEGEWSKLHERFRASLASLPRRASLDELQLLLNSLSELRTKIVNRLDKHDKMQNMRARESQNERHIQDSNTQSFYESEAEMATEHSTVSEINVTTEAATKENRTAITANERLERLKPNIPLENVLRACEEIHLYGSGGSIKTWRELLTATAVLRSILQIDPSTFHEACLAMGPENAAVAIACIFERGGQINSAGAYLRNLSKRATQRQFTVKPMVTALLRSKAGVSSPMLPTQYAASARSRSRGAIKDVFVQDGYHDTTHTEVPHGREDLVVSLNAQLPMQSSIGRLSKP